MIKVTVLYPNGDGTRFDHDYYVQKHIPLVVELLGPGGLRRGEVERGLAGGDGSAPPPFHAGVHLYFDSMEAFGAALAPHADRIMGDIPRYTNAAPIFQYSEVVGS